MSNDEYVQCMIYAGWIQEEDIDDEYQVYLKIDVDTDGHLDYEQWKATTQEATELQKIIDYEFPPFDYSKHTTEQESRLQSLLSQSSNLEWLLGY